MMSWKRLVTPILLWYDDSRNSLPIGIWIVMQTVLTLWTLHIIAMVAGHDELLAIVASAVIGTVFLVALYTAPSSGVLKTVCWLYICPAQLATLPLVLAGIAAWWFGGRWWRAAVETWPTWKRRVRPKRLNPLDCFYVIACMHLALVGFVLFFAVPTEPMFLQVGVVGVLYLPIVHLVWRFVIRPVLTLAVFVVITTRAAITSESPIPQACIIRERHEPV